MSEWTIRPATRDDIDAVIRLRALMFSAMGVAGVDDDAWRRAATEWLERELPGRHTLVVLAEGPDGDVVAGAMGALRFETPSPVNPNGVWGLLNNVATEPHARRQGLARACVEGVHPATHRAAANVDGYFQRSLRLLGVLRGQGAQPQREAPDRQSGW
ncbi:GNAT family N-acetyltransferase [Monashia sp. NPDC004114]